MILYVYTVRIFKMNFYVSFILWAIKINKRIKCYKFLGLQRRLTGISLGGVKVMIIFLEDICSCQGIFPKKQEDKANTSQIFYLKLRYKYLFSW